MRIKRIHNGRTTALALEGDLDRQGAVQLKRAFDALGNRNRPLILDFQNVGLVGMIGLACLEQEANRRTAVGGRLRVIRIPQRLQDLFSATQLDKQIEVDPFCDETAFIERSDIPLQVRKQWKSAHKVKEEKCPKCKAVLRPGAHACMECGETVKLRRATRHSVPLPMLYRTISSHEFVSGKWSPAITDDIDLDRFSGVGFFTTDRFDLNQELHIIFPTLQPQRDDNSCHVLIVFRGRVKNQIRMGEYYRAGLALFDYYEYEGAWEIVDQNSQRAI
jgi:anti-anti-sigma factor